MGLFLTLDRRPSPILSSRHSALESTGNSLNHAVSIHTSPTSPRNPDKTRCAVPGCRAWSLRGSDPPRCSPHSGRAGAPPGNQNRLVHGFYASTLQPDELADLAAHAGATTLDAEIAITRIALRRILAMLLTGLTPGPNAQPLDANDYARFIALAFHGAGAIARLLRARQQLGGDQSDQILASFDQALDELGAKRGIQL